MEDLGPDFGSVVEHLTTSKHFYPSAARLTSSLFPVASTFVGLMLGPSTTLLSSNNLDPELLNVSLLFSSLASVVRFLTVVYPDSHFLLIN